MLCWKGTGAELSSKLVVITLRHLGNLGFVTHLVTEVKDMRL